VVTPDRWSAGVRFGTTAEEQEEGESLDQLLAEEEPEAGAEDDELGHEDDDEAEEREESEDLGWDENATEGDIIRLMAEDGPDPRAGRLVADDEGAHAAGEADLVAHDEGIDSGGATAEEAAVHLADDEADENDDDYDG
jgi:nitroreductase